MEEKKNKKHLQKKAARLLFSKMDVLSPSFPKQLRKLNNILSEKSIDSLEAIVRGGIKQMSHAKMAGL